MCACHVERCEAPPAAPLCRGPWDAAKSGALARQELAAAPHPAVQQHASHATAPALDLEEPRRASRGGVASAGYAQDDGTGREGQQVGSVSREGQTSTRPGSANAGKAALRAAEREARERERLVIAEDKQVHHCILPPLQHSAGVTHSTKVDDYPAVVEDKQVIR